MYQLCEVRIDLGMLIGLHQQYFVMVLDSPDTV